MKPRVGPLARSLALLVAVALSACPDSPGFSSCRDDADCPQGFSCDPADRVCRTDEPSPDAGTADGARLDAARADTGRADGQVRDASAADANATDHGAPDGAGLDLGVTDADVADAGAADTDVTDSGVADSGVTDSGGTDGADGFPAPWWDERWPHRLRLRLHNAESHEELWRLPILVELAPGHVVHDLAQPGGEDLRFVDSEGIPLPHEVERWDPSLTSVIWVTAPSVAAGRVDSAIYLYLGNPAPPLREQISAWPEEYQLVVLFKGDTAAQAFADSSPAGHEIVAGSHIRRSGVHGFAAELGVEEHLDVATLGATGFPQEQGSYSFWAYSDDWSSLSAGLLDDDTGDERSHLSIGVHSDTVLAAALEGPSWSESTAAQTAAPSNGWSRYTVVWNTTNGQAWLRLFRTNALSDEITLPAAWRPSGQHFIVAGATSLDATIYLDDLRLTNRARSEDWIRAEWLVDKDLFVIFEQTPTPPEPERGGAGIAVAPVVLYEFDETIGTTVHDSADNGAALDLEIADADAVEWLGGALRVKRATVIESASTVGKFTEQCPQLNAMTVEAWVQPDNTLHRGPARIVSLSSSHLASNFMLGQTLHPVMRGRARYAFRFRTTETDVIGRLITADSRLTALSADDDAERPALRRQQVVFTWDGAEVCSYVDGTLSSEGCLAWGGTTDGVWTDETLTLVNEFHSDDMYARPWLGTLYRIALYCDALTAGEVLSSYQAGNMP